MEGDITYSKGRADQESERTSSSQGGFTWLSSQCIIFNMRVKLSEMVDVWFAYKCIPISKVALYAVRSLKNI